MPNSNIADVLRNLMPPAQLESVRGNPVSLLPPAERIPDHLRHVAEPTAHALASGAALSGEQAFFAEAVIYPEMRPSVLIRKGRYELPQADWAALSAPTATKMFEGLIPSVCRVNLVGGSTPYAGTAFVVGDRLLMTNRHVAAIFWNGVGRRNLAPRAGMAAGINFAFEAEGENPPDIPITDVVMIHPHWDMALLRVEALPANVKPLTLSRSLPDTRLGDTVAIVGYPAMDDRNGRDAQLTAFKGAFMVKRFAPGRIGGGPGTETIVRKPYPSFGHDVSAVLHNASTLGGNSGSAVFDAVSGEVIGLHFAGEYLKFNCAVPSGELARDRRIEDMGVRFSGRSIGDAAAWRTQWEAAEGEGEMGTERKDEPSGGGTPPRCDVGANGDAAGRDTVGALDASGAVRLNVPLEITVRLGQPSLGGAARRESAVDLASSAATEAFREPIHDTDYATRTGYDPAFLGPNLPMPEATDPALISATDEGPALLYQNFSIVMHKKRRLAILAAANVDGSRAMKSPEPGKDTGRNALRGFGKEHQEKWFTDDRIPVAHQLPDRFFNKDRQSFDKGHLVRREDVAWGRTYAELQRANGDSYHVTNCSPQVKEFNRADGESNWGQLEKFVEKTARRTRVTLFCGPVLAADDRAFDGVDDVGRIQVPIPRAFWKVMVTAENGGVQAFAFVLEQDLSSTRMTEAVPIAFLPKMVRLADLERRLGIVRFPAILIAADQYDTEHGESVRAETGLGGDAGRPPRQRRTSTSLREGPVTFRDPLLSLFQSATAAAERGHDAASALRAAATTTEGVAPPAGSLMLAAEAACEAVANGESFRRAEATTEGVIGDAGNWAPYLLELMRVRIMGTTAEADALYDKIKGGGCDPAWLDTVNEYAKNYGLFGDPDKRAYVPPGEAQKPLALPASENGGELRIAIFGDWGTGASAAKKIIADIAAMNPDVLMHLGDIYYSGTPLETKDNFKSIINKTFKNAPPPIYTLCGNHDMYSGGEGFYGLIKSLNTPDLRQSASYFCLRSADGHWQLLGMDTGRNDYHPLAHAVTFIDPREEAWLEERMGEFEGRTILLSHHQLFSPFSPPGQKSFFGKENPVNDRLKTTYDRLVAAAKNRVEPVAAWFWGHEHNLCIYESHSGLRRGRCVGHGAIPVVKAEKTYAPASGLDNPPRLIPGTTIAVDGDFHAHGFALLTLKGGTATVTYHQRVGGMLQEHYRETM